jgi:hypothetical protein
MTIYVLYRYSSGGGCYIEGIYKHEADVLAATEDDDDLDYDEYEVEE